jgi:CRP-like cAMP-binding protein
MSKEKLIAFIQKVHPVSEEKIAEIVMQFQPMQIVKNNFFIKEGKISNQYLFLENGFIRSFIYDVEGNEVTTEFYSGGQVVFEVASFFQKSLSKENFQALEDCTGWFITFDQLQVLFHSVPEFREFGRMILVKGFISFKQRTLSLINQSAEERYRTLIETRPQLFLKAPLKYTASYLGVTDTSLSRIRKELLSNNFTFLPNGKSGVI